VPETNHVSTVHSVAAGLYFQFVLHVMLFPMFRLFGTFPSALHAVSVQCPIWLFAAVTLISSFTGMLLRYCLSDCEMDPVAPVITVITVALPYHLLTYLLHGAESFLRS
jgi:hypothetical protein